MRTFAITLFCISIFSINISYSQDALSILNKMDALMQAPKDKQAIVKITTNNKSGKEKVREAIMKQKGKDKRLYQYTQPESQAGIATLSLPDDVMWMYMPAFGKPKKISLLAKSQAFTGTDFSYEDMEARPYAERYDPKLTETTNDGFILELTPKSDKSSYNKIMVKVDKTNFYPIKMEYYDKRDELFKEAHYTYQKSGKYWYASEVIMADLKKEHSTVIEMTDVIFDQGLSDDVFDVENLAPKKEEEQKEK
ncbi:MAG: outer membrane lipoprotein-sorting protein [Bacteroidales bacterium]